MDRVFGVVRNSEAEFGCDEGEREPVALVTRTEDQEKHALTYADKFKFVFIRKIVRVIRASIMQCSHEVGLSVYCMYQSPTSVVVAVTLCMCFLPICPITTAKSCLSSIVKMVSTRRVANTSFSLMLTLSIAYLPGGVNPIGLLVMVSDDHFVC